MEIRIRTRDRRRIRTSKDTGWATGELTVSEGKGFSLQNFGYALQWWAFTIFAPGLWLRIVRDHSRSLPAGERARSGRVTSNAPPRRPRSTVATSRPLRARSAPDPAQAAYNAYLTQLDQKGKS